MKQPAQASLGRVFCCHRINFQRLFGGAIKRRTVCYPEEGHPAQCRGACRCALSPLPFPCILHAGGNTILLTYLSYAILLRTCGRAMVKLHDGNGVLTEGRISSERGERGSSVAEEHL